MDGYSVKFVETSLNLTTKEKIALKDTALFQPLDELTKGTKFRLAPVGYIVLDIHNEKSKDQTDYRKYVVKDKDGHYYMTGSEAFFTSFKDIFTDMQNEAPDEEYEIDVYQIESKNYKGKSFLSCSIVL